MSGGGGGGVEHMQQSALNDQLVSVKCPCYHSVSYLIESSHGGLDNERWLMHMIQCGGRG